jgi:hypothetical protein
MDNLHQADALLFGRVTDQMMEAAFRPPAPPAARADWMEPFARTIDAAKKQVVSSALDRVDLKPVSRLELGSGAVAMRHQPRRQGSPADSTAS